MKANLDKMLRSKVGDEPRLVLLLNDDDTCNTTFVISDGIKLCNLETLEDGILFLIASYYVLNLSYPKKYEQLFGFLQLVCLQQDFPIKARSNGFTSLKENLI